MKALTRRSNRACQQQRRLSNDLSSHFVTELDHAAYVGLDLGQVERDVPVELLEEGDPVADQDRQDRVAHLVGQPETKTLARDDATSDEPDRAEARPQALIDELREVAGVELDGGPGPRQV